MWKELSEKQEPPEERLLKHAQYIIANVEVTGTKEGRLQVWGFSDDSRIFKRQKKILPDGYTSSGSRSQPQKTAE